MPAGWVLQDNQSVSNFASDEDAVLDALSAETSNSRWMMLGNLGTSDADRVMALGDTSNFEEVATVLHEYFYTAEYALTPPTMITLSNGKQASFSVGVNENLEGWASSVYFIEGRDGVYINLFVEARQDILLENLELVRAIAESVTLR